MPHNFTTRETLVEALERFEDVLAFHYPKVSDAVHVPTDAHPRMVTQMADALIDGLPVTVIL